MNKIISFCLLLIIAMPNATAAYERNKAVPVEQVLFGHIVSSRNVNQQELIEDKNHGWKVFGGALLGGVIGNQFGGGSGRTLATILGSVIGGSVTNNRNNEYSERTIYLVELMIKVEDGEEYMVLQDYDPNMVFSKGDAVRMVFLEGGNVRIDMEM